MERKFFQREIIVIILYLLLGSDANAGQHKILRVVDGDTIIIDYHGKKERVRLLCVDTPESVHPDKSKNTDAGRKASEYTKSRLTGKTVDLEFDDKTRGKYGRLLAYVILDGENFNVELVREGWSPYYTKYGVCPKYHDRFVSAEYSAKSESKHIWDLEISR